MCPLMFDCTVYSAPAAAENEPWSAIATSALSWRISISRNDSNYLRMQLERWVLLVHTFT